MSLEQKNNFWNYLLKPFMSLWAFVFAIISIIYTVLVINPFNTYRQKDLYQPQSNQHVWIVNFLPKRNFIFFRNFAHFVKSWFGFGEIKPEVDEKRFQEILSQILSKQGQSACDVQFCFKGLEYLTEEQKEQLKQFTKKDDYEFYTLKTDDGAHLDSFKIKGHSQKYIIYCMARDMNYSKYIVDGSFQKIVDETDATLISFNYRGIDRSKGLIFRERHLVNDTLAQVKVLLDAGVEPKNITLYGHCLGGAIATLAAGKLNEHGIAVRLFNDRSFKSISKFVIGFVFPDENATYFNPINHIRFLMGMTFYPFLLLPTALLAGWQMDAQSSWEKIADENKTYSVVKKLEGHRVEQNDGIVHTQIASIASTQQSLQSTDKHCYHYCCSENGFFKKGHFFKMDELKQENSEQTLLQSFCEFVR